MKHSGVFQNALLAVTIALGVGGVAVAGPFEDATAAYERHDYATALTLWRPLADQGNAMAQFSLGNRYARGEGVPKNAAGRPACPCARSP